MSLLTKFKLALLAFIIVLAGIVWFGQHQLKGYEHEIVQLAANNVALFKQDDKADFFKNTRVLESTAQQYLSHARMWFLILVSLSILVMLALVLLVAFRVIKPLYRLKQRMESKEDLDHYLGAKSDFNLDSCHEVKSLAAAIEKKLYHILYYDQVTGLPNHFQILHELDVIMRAIDKAHGQRIAIFVLSVNNIMDIIEAHGADLANKLLKQLSIRIVEKGITEDFLTGLVNREFFVLMLVHCHEDDGLEAVTAKANALLKATREPLQMRGDNFYLNTNVGIAFYPGDAENSQDLLKAAMAAAGEAKRKGPGRISFYSESLNDRLFSLLKLEADINEAIKNKEFELFYQPQIDLKTNQVVGAEALIRWVHPKEGYIRPDVFIPLAEEKGLILPIGQWVIEAAVSDYEKLRAQKINLPRIGINISAKQLFHQDLVDIFEKRLKAHQVQAECIELEITESDIVSDIDEAAKLLERLKSIGFKIAIDDFGTGQSSLSYVQSLPIDKLKIDQAFIRELELGKNKLIVNNILSLAEALNMKVIAEGVSHPSHAEFLKTHGCHEAQGYLYSKPLPLDEFIRFIAKSSSN